MTTDSKAVDALLASGLRNIWHAICPSHFITAQPKPLKRLGLKLVLWRDRSGTLHALEDRCPHRGAPLSQGIVIDDRIACGYHGVQVNAAGVAVCVPGSPGSRLEGLKCVASFPVEERAGAVFLYVGDALNPSPPALRVPMELESAEHSRFLSYAEWASDYRYAFDNAIDPMHGTYLHKQSHSMSGGESVATFRIRDTETGFVFEKENQVGVNFDWSEFIDTSAHWIRVEIPYPPSGGPGGPFIIIATYTPINESTMAAFHWRCRKVQGWQRDTWRFLYKNRLEARHWAVLEQDRAMLEAFDLDARDNEMLYQHDLGVVRLRRLLRSKAQRQLEALARPSSAAAG